MKPIPSPTPADRGLVCSRRGFLAGAAALCVLPRAHAIEPFQRPAPPRLRLGLAAYSFRDFFRDQPGGRPGKGAAARPMDMAGFIDYCAAQGCDGAELTSYYFPSPVTADGLLALRRQAFLRGVSICGTAVGNTFTHPPGSDRDREVALVKDWVDRARILGAPHIRVFAGTAGGQSIEDARRHCIGALEECAETAGRAGVFLGLENHGGIVADASSLLEIVRAVRSPWVGINLDTGNFHSDDPYAELARCAPYAVNVQVKVEVRRRNGQPEPADLGRISRLLREAGYQGWVTLEYEAAEDPYTAVPRHLRALEASLREIG